jgi:hypothetical protein
MDNMKKNTLYIHIGCEKTGTTSIQYALSDNRELLRRQGFVYPILGNFKFAQSILPAALQHWETPLRPNADYYPGEEPLDKEVVWNDFVSFAKENRDKNIIISSEHFSSRMVKDISLTFIHSKISELAPFFDVKVIIYLRRQDKFMESTYSTIIKAGGNLGFDDFLKTHIDQDFRYNFSVILNLWSSYFGKSSLIVKDYETEVRTGGLLNSFFDIVGVDSSKLILENKNENVSWPSSVIELARFCNTPRVSSILGNHRVTFLDSITKTLPQKERTKAYKFNSEQRNTILQRYKASNKAVEAEYFSGAPVFSELTEEESQTDQVLSNEVGVTKQKIAELISHFYMKHKDKID